MLIVEEKHLSATSDTADSNSETSSHVPAGPSGKAALPSHAAPQDAPPPPYHQPIQELASTSSTSASITHARSNYLELSEAHRHIKGNWFIDSSLVIPPSILQHQQWDEKDGPRPNLNLHNRNGSIKGKIILCGPSEDSVTLKVACRHGATNLKVDNRTNQKMQMDVSSRHGSITLYLPSTFTGHIESTTCHGKMTFSDTVSQNLTRFSARGGKHLSFLSPSPIPSGPEGSTAFDNAPHNLVIETVHGSMKIYYLEEFPDEVEEDKLKSQKKGLFGRLFSN